ncbi:MAG: DinB family protein [Ilumatobacteraceae bacterium]
MNGPSIDDLLAEYDRALTHTDALWRDLTPDEVRWRPHADFSPIGWHLGHQSAVAHFMVRNLTAAEPSPDPDLDPVMDSAHPEARRDEIPDVDRIDRYRTAVAERVRFRIGNIRDGRVGAPAQLAIVARTLVTALVNHEYQHSQWIAEVRRDHLDRALPPAPTSSWLTTIDGYTVLLPG